MYRRVLFSILLVATIAFAADEPKRPGTVNFVQGTVYLQDNVVRLDDDSRMVMAVGQHLRAVGGNAEVFSTPGSVIHMGTTAEIEMIASDDESATLRLLKGAIVAEVYKIKKSAALTIVVGDSQTTITAKGEFRFDAKDNNGSALHVLQGKATLAAGGSDQELKKKQMAEVSSEGVEVAKFKEFPQDALTIWHERRAETVRASVFEAPGYFGMGDLPDASRAGITR